MVAYLHDGTPKEAGTLRWEHVKTDATCSSTGPKHRNTLGVATESFIVETLKIFTQIKGKDTCGNVVCFVGLHKSIIFCDVTYPALCAAMFSSAHIKYLLFMFEEYYWVYYLQTESSLLHVTIPKMTEKWLVEVK